MSIEDTEKMLEDLSEKYGVSTNKVANILLDKGIRSTRDASFKDIDVIVQEGLGRKQIEKPMSHLDTLKEAHPDFPWPTKGEKGHYPEELGAMLGDTRRFGFPPKQYTLIFRTSSEDSAITRVEQYNTEGKQALITYNPTRLETYGVWIR